MTELLSTAQDREQSCFRMKGKMGQEWCREAGRAREMRGDGSQNGPVRRGEGVGDWPYFFTHDPLTHFYSVLFLLGCWWLGRLRRLFLNSRLCTLVEKALVWEWETLGSNLCKAGPGPVPEEPSTTGSPLALQQTLHDCQPVLGYPGALIGLGEVFHD